jgi:hypothetical protein
MARDHSGYLRRIAQMQTLWGLVPTTWQISVVGALSAVAAYLGFQSGGLFYAAIGAVIVFAFGMIGVFFMLLILRQIGIFGKLAISGIGITTFGVTFSPQARSRTVTELKHLSMNFAVQNNSYRDIHFRVLRGDLSILGTINQNASTSDNIHIVPAGQQQLLLFATIETIVLPKIDFSKPAVSPITGKIVLEIRYGPNSETLPYVLLYEAEPSIGMNIVPQKTGQPAVQLPLLVAIRRYVHKRIGM